MAVLAQLAPFFVLVALVLALAHGFGARPPRASLMSLCAAALIAAVLVAGPWWS